jgi:transposase
MGKESLKELERRRLRGGRLLTKGFTQAQVARELDVSATTVSRWAQTLAAGGLQALKTQRPRGRQAGLDAAQRRELARALKRGAMVNGFATELWTLPRVGQLIEELFGRRYSDSQVWRILTAMKWSCQRPTGRATQRDEPAITQWKEKRWPALKKTPENAAKPSSSSTSRG